MVSASSQSCIVVWARPLPLLTGSRHTAIQAPSLARRIHAIWRPGIHGPVIEYPPAFTHIGSSSRRGPVPRAGKALDVSMRTGRSTRCRVRYPHISPAQLSNTLSNYSSCLAARRHPRLSRVWVWNNPRFRANNEPMVLTRRIVVLVFALGCCLLIPSCAPIVGKADPTNGNAEVVRVVDGDTVDIRHDDRGRLRIRILGINAPETHKRGWTVGCYGPESATWAGAFLPVGQRVSTVTDPTQGPTDRYGRTLAYLDLPDGRDFSVESVRAGHVPGRHLRQAPGPAVRGPRRGRERGQDLARRPLGAALLWRDRIGSRVGRAPGRR